MLDILLDRAPTPSLAKQSQALTSQQFRVLALTGAALFVSFLTWFGLSLLDSLYTPRAEEIILNRRLVLSYQWCMVGYMANLVLTLVKLIFEGNGARLSLHLVSVYINFVAAIAYYMMWSGFSPILMGIGSCLYLPQRWLLYLFTAPHMLYMLSQMSDCSNRTRFLLLLENAITCTFGGLGTVPWFSKATKVMCVLFAIMPFPFTNMRILSMVKGAMMENKNDPSSLRALRFIGIFTIITWNMFPIVYFASIDGYLSVNVIEPLWACLDWAAKMVYSSSLMEANFFTIAQKKDIAKAAEAAKRIEEIDQLNQDLTRKDDFLSAMSHELRTPLNGIIGLSESLMIGVAGELPAKSKDTIATIKMSGQRLLQLINDILDAAKMKQGSLVIKHQDVDVQALMKDVMEITKSLVSRKVEMINKIGNMPHITGDGDRIVQIMYNLIGNASKFTRSGSITVSGGVSKDGLRIFLSVSDTGLGIPKDKFGQIFGAFEQVDMSTTRSYGGTGLGLHLVKQLVEAHNGEITVDSTLGQGSVFTVWLPISQNSAPFEATKTDSTDWDEDGDHAQDSLSHSKSGLLTTRPFYQDLNPNQYLVLSVDDDAINQMVVENLLSPEGFKVDKAMDGDDALEYLEKAQVLPDIILLDVMMPAMSGFEVCRTIRKKYKASVLPIIMLSAKGAAEVVAQGLESGANDYMKKPFDRLELISRIRHQISARNALRSGDF